jgi:uncharacterized membrane protein
LLPNRARTVLGIFLGLVTLAYPFLVYLGLAHFEPWILAAVLAFVLVLRLAAARHNRHWVLPVLVVAVLFFILAMWRNDPLTLRFYPVLINAVMLIVFGWSLLFPPTVIERIARIRHPDLPGSGVRYTRRVTQVWSLFFLVNGGIALYTALWADLDTWCLYNGFIAYLMMGALFAVEYAIRRRVQAHHTGP